MLVFFRSSSAEKQGWEALGTPGQQSVVPASQSVVGFASLEACPLRGPAWTMWVPLGCTNAIMLVPGTKSIREDVPLESTSQL